MADSKISALTALTATTDDDLLVVVDSTDPATATGMDKKMTVLNFLTPVYQAVTDAIATAEAYTDAAPTLKTVAGTAYTFTLTDAGNTLLELTTNLASTLTIPTNGSVAFPTPSFIDIVNVGSGTATIDDSLVNPLQGAVSTIHPNGNVSIYSRGTATWRVLGGA